MKKLSMQALTIVLTLFCLIPVTLSAAMPAVDRTLAVAGPAIDDQALEEKRLNGRFYIDCDRGATLTWALRQARKFSRAEVMFRGTCEETLLIDRDHLTLRGLDVNAALIGVIDVVGGSNVVIKDFEIRGGDNHPTGTPFGAVNAVDGSAINVSNMHIHDISARGIRVISSSARLRDITVEQAVNGAFVFRGSNMVLEGQIRGEGGAFGMSFVDSNAFARNADLDFRGGVFGLVVQLSSGLEHVEGSLIAEDNAIGILISGQGAYAFGSFIEVRRNSAAGILVDELSSLTPLNNAPGGGPSLVVEDHAGFGVVVNRGSTLQLTDPTTIAGNGLGLFVDSSTLIMAGASLHDNGFNMDLSFGSWVTFQAGNTIAEPYQCDVDVLARGATFCDGGSAAPSSERLNLPQVQELLKTMNAY